MSTNIFVIPTKQVDNRGLALFCSQCPNKAVWYGQGGTAYCDACWPGERHEWACAAHATDSKID